MRLEAMVRLFLVLGLAVATAACSEPKAKNNLAGDNDGGDADGGGDNDGGDDDGGDDDTAECLADSVYDDVELDEESAVAESFSSTDIEEGFPNFWMYSYLTDDDFLQLELYDGFGLFEEGIAAGTYTISGDETSYSSCGLCVYIGLGDTEGTGGFAQALFATGGTLTLDSFAGTLTGTLSDLTFVETDDELEALPSSTCESALDEVVFNVTLTEFGAE